MKFPRLLITFLILWFLIQAAVFIAFAGINEDEGWYLVAARETWNDRLPLRDFAFTQTPGHPLIFQVAAGALGLGLTGCRIVTLLFALAAMGVSIVASERFSGCWGGVLCAAVWAFCPYGIHFMVIVKTYALASCFLGVFVYAYFRLIDSPANLKWIGLATVALVMAIVTRFSLIVLPPVFAGILWLMLPRGKRWMAIFQLLICFALLAALMAWILGGLSIGSLKFYLVDFHLGRYDSMGMMRALRGKFVALSQIVQFFLVPAVVMLSLIFIFMANPLIGMKRFIAKSSPICGLAVMILVVTAAQLYPAGAYAEYATILMPLLSVLVACSGVAAFEFLGKDHRLLGTAVSAAILMAGWLSYDYRHIDVSDRRRPVDEVNELASRINGLTKPKDRIFTFHPIIAIQAERQLLHGLEMGIFSFWPELQTGRAAELKLVNDDLALAMILEQKPAVVVLGESNLLESGSYAPLDAEDRKRKRMEFVDLLLREGYTADLSLDGFGQWRESVQLYVRRSHFEK